MFGRPPEGKLDGQSPVLFDNHRQKCVRVIEMCVELVREGVRTCPLVVEVNDCVG